MERDFQKKKLKKPMGGGSGISFDELDILQEEGDSTESLLAEIDDLLDASLKPIEQEEKEKEKEKQIQKKSESSGRCGCF